MKIFIILIAFALHHQYCFAGYDPMDAKAAVTQFFQEVDSIINNAPGEKVNYANAFQQCQSFWKISGSEWVPHNVENIETVDHCAVSVWLNQCLPKLESLDLQHTNSIKTAKNNYLNSAVAKYFKGKAPLKSEL